MSRGEVARARQARALPAEVAQGNADRAGRDANKEGGGAAAR